MAICACIAGVRQPPAMNVDEVMAELAARASETTKRTLLRHGAKEPLFGVRIGDMKPLHKKLRGQQELALQLYATGNGDAQYLAGMIADGKRMTSAQLSRWVKTASWKMISGTTVPWVASEHPEGLDLALAWIESPEPAVAVSGWNTLSALATIKPDGELPLQRYGSLLARVARELLSAADEVRYAMNGFVIACGTYIAALGDQALATARKLGKVEAQRGDTACTVPEAEGYILKARRGAPSAPKRKTTRC